MARGASARRTTERISLVAEVAAIPPRWWLYEPQKQGKSRFSKKVKLVTGHFFFFLAVKRAMAERAYLGDTYQWVQHARCQWTVCVP